MTSWTRWNVWNVLTCFIMLWGILRRFGVERPQNVVVIPVKIQLSCVERHVALLRHSKGWVDSEWQKLRYRAKSLRWIILFVASRDMISNISIHEHVFESFLDHVTWDTEKSMTTYLTWSSKASVCRESRCTSHCISIFGGKATNSNAGSQKCWSYGTGIGKWRQSTSKCGQICFHSFISYHFLVHHL